MADSLPLFTGFFNPDGIGFRAVIKADAASGAPLSDILRES
jgi:hypothetical protein